MFSRKIGLPIVIAVAFALTACDEELLSALYMQSSSSEMISEDLPQSSSSTESVGDEFEDIEDQDLSDNTIQEIRDLVNSMNSNQLNAITSKSGLSKDEILEYVDFLDQYENGKTDPTKTVSCSGTLTDSLWKMESVEDYGLVSVSTISTAAISDSSMKVVDTKIAKLSNAAVCSIALKTGIANRYSAPQESDNTVQIYCDKENLVRKEFTTFENIDNTMRILIYDQMQKSCKAEEIPTDVSDTTL